MTESNENKPAKKEAAPAAATQQRQKQKIVISSINLVDYVNEPKSW